MSQLHQQDGPSSYSTPSSTTGGGASYVHSVPHHSAYQYATSTSGMGEGNSTPGGDSPLAANHPNPTAHPVYQAMFPEPDLPIANISRIMKRSLPDNAKIAKDAKECIQDCVSELISFITSEASDKCGVEKRKTINGDDVLYAMRVLGFDNYEEVLRVYLSRYRMAQEQNPRTRKRPSTQPSRTVGVDKNDPDNDGDELDDDEAENDNDDEDDAEERDVAPKASDTSAAEPDPTPNPSQQQQQQQQRQQPPLPQRDAMLTMQNLLQD